MGSGWVSLHTGSAPRFPISRSWSAPERAVSPGSLRPWISKHQNKKMCLTQRSCDIRSLQMSRVKVRPQGPLIQHDWYPYKKTKTQREDGHVKTDTGETIM